MGAVESALVSGGTARGRRGNGECGRRVEGEGARGGRVRPRERRA